MKKNIRHIVAVLVIMLMAGSLRAPITAVSPVLGEIIDALNLNSIQGSLLTSIPLMVFALGSIFAGKLALRIGLRTSLLFSIFFLSLGIYLRIYGTLPMLYIGSFLLGAGICIGNVLLPAYIKTVFPERIGLVTGIFTVTMNVLAALASGFSISIGQFTRLGWVGSLGIWIILGICTFLVIVVDIFLNTAIGSSTALEVDAPKFNVFRSRQAWNISVFMGIQALVYYSLVAWLPLLLADYGMPKVSGGMVLLIVQLSSLPVSFLVPIIAMRSKDQKWIVIASGSSMLIGILLLLGFQLRFVYLAALMLGMAIGTAFSLAILFFSIKSGTGHGLLKISGKAQSLGYLIAAFGPLSFGWLHEKTGVWEYPLFFLLLVTIVMLIFGRFAARPKFIEEH